MKLYDFDMAQSFAPNCDIFGQFGGGLLGGALNLAGTLGAEAMNVNAQQDTNAANIAMNDATNAANIQIAENTNKTNLQIAREANALSQAEADKAYERSTANNQISELVKAGYSPQQAKTIVAGTGAAAAYTPAPIQAAQAQGATLTPGHADAPQINAGAIGSAFGGLGAAAGALSADIDRPDGGAIGQTLYGDVSFDLQQLDGYNPAKIYSIQHFVKLANEKNEDGSYKRQSWYDFTQTAAFKRMQKSMLGRRAFNADHSTYIESKNRSIETLANAVKFDMEVINKELSQMNLDAQRLFQQPMIDVKLADYAGQLVNLKYRVDYNEDYLVQHLKKLCVEEEGQMILAEVLKMKNSDTRKAYENLGAARPFMAAMDIYKELGLTQTTLGTLVAWLSASGINITGSLKNVIDAFTDHFPNTLSNIEGSITLTADKLGEVLSGIEDLSAELKARIQRGFFGK